MTWRLSRQGGAALHLASRLQPQFFQQIIHRGLRVLGRFGASFPPESGSGESSLGMLSGQGHWDPWCFRGNAACNGAAPETAAGGVGTATEGIGIQFPIPQGAVLPLIPSCSQSLARTTSDAEATRSAKSEDTSTLKPAEGGGALLVPLQFSGFSGEKSPSQRRGSTSSRPLQSSGSAPWGMRRIRGEAPAQSLVFILSVRAESLLAGCCRQILGAGGQPKARG